MQRGVHGRFAVFAVRLNDPLRALGLLNNTHPSDTVAVDSGVQARLDVLDRLLAGIVLPLQKKKRKSDGED